VIMDRPFCLQQTIPDFWIPELKLAIYLDGKPHRGREDHDELLREQLRKRHGVRVLSIPYEANTEQERERVFGVIMEALKS